MAPKDRGRPQRILILGGGFAGVYTAYRLQKQLKGLNARVAVVNRENHFVFYPMLPEIISGNIETEHVLTPIRLTIPHATLFVGEVTNIDAANQRVEILHGLYGHQQQPRTLYYDHLVLALGGVPGTQIVPGLEEHAFNVQRLTHAFALRNHLIDALEQANTRPDSEERRQLLTFVVIGGGASGVEVLAELHSLIDEALPHYRSLCHEDVRVVIVHAGPKLMQDLHPKLADYTNELMRKRGIEVRCETRVTKVERNAVHLNDGSVIAAQTIVGSLGLAPNPLVRALPLPHDKAGRLEVDEMLRAGGTGNIWAIGDNASVFDPHTGKPYPATAQHAVEQAKIVAHNIAASLRAAPLRPMSYKTWWRLFPLGRQSGVAQFFDRVTLSGFPAWWLWRTYYLFQLPRWEKRLRVMMDWTLDLAFPPTLVQLKVGQPTPMAESEVVDAVAD